LRQALESDPTLLEVRLLMININVERQKYDEAREGLRQIRATITNQMVTKFIDEQLSALGG
jgi:thioredoxin-like negative regulator of GroEL